MIDIVKIKVFRYVLHGTWLDGKFEHNVTASSKKAAEAAFRANAPVNKSVKITEFEVRESFYIYFERMI